LRTVLGYAGIDRARLPGRAKGTAGRRGRAEPWGAAFLFCRESDLGSGGDPRSLTMGWMP
jgi:hypothetical protein